MVEFQNNSFELIDRSFFEFFTEDLNLHANSFDGWNPVPVVWGTPERAFQAKNNKELRDEDGALVLPIVSVWRTGLSNSLDKKGSAVNVIPPKPGAKGGSIIIHREVNQEKTSNFQRKDFFNSTLGELIGKPAMSSKIVYDSYSIDMPVYSIFTYKVQITAQYQQQLNEILQPILNYGFGHKYFTIHKYNHTLEVFPQSDFTPLDSDVTESERLYEVTATFDVLANTSGDGDNSQKPRVVRNENVVEFRIGRERNLTTTDLKELSKKTIKLKG